MDENWFKTLIPYLEYYNTNIQNEDQQRIEAITPYFEHYHVQDIIHLVKEYLFKLRIRNQIKHLGQIYNINDCSIVFNDTFNKLYVSDDKKSIIINILMNFMNLCNNIKKNFRTFPVFSKGFVEFKISSNSLSLCATTKTMKCEECIKY